LRTCGLERVDNHFAAGRDVGQVSKEPEFPYNFYLERFREG